MIIFILVLEILDEPLPRLNRVMDHVILHEDIHVLFHNVRVENVVVLLLKHLSVDALEQVHYSLQLMLVIAVRIFVLLEHSLGILLQVHESSLALAINEIQLLSLP